MQYSRNVNNLNNGVSVTSAIISPEDLLNHPEMINHPAHYGGEDNPYEAIKVIEAWDLDFNLGNCLKYISRLGKKDDSNLSKDEKTLEDLQKAAWYLQREIDRFRVRAGKQVMQRGEKD